jgi:aspartate carbamoyltransferase catalytic subunit
MLLSASIQGMEAFFLKGDRVMSNCHFIGMQGLPKNEIERLLAKARILKKEYMANAELEKCLQGKKVAVLFFENSTRTRLSFELAAKTLGATVVSISADASSVKKGESVYDTLKNIEAMGVDCTVMRHPMSGVLAQIADCFAMTLVNAGDGMNEHPTQALLDMLTLSEVLGSLESKRVLIMGDILHSRVARSNIWGLKTLGAYVSVAGPREWIPQAISQWGVDYEGNIDDALAKADAVIVLRIQKERQEDGSVPNLNTYNEFFGLNKQRMRALPNDPFILHPGPVNRGMEISSEVVDGEKSQVYQQVLNGIAVRMAVLKTYVGGL